jgi:hypothetical protein
MRQDEVEALFSPENNMDMLVSSITAECDRSLLTWALGCFCRIDSYLDGEYYESKNKRLVHLRTVIASVGLQELISTILATVIKVDQDRSLQAITGAVGAILGYEDPFDGIKTAGELVALCQGTIFEITRNEQDDPIVKVRRWTTIRKLFGAELEFIWDTHFHPPLIEKPKRVTNNHSCGYHTVKVPLLLGRFTKHNNKLDYETINILNNQKWVLNEEMLMVGEQPASDLMTPEDRLNFMRHRRESKRIYRMLGKNPFYLAWQYDSRGRMYSHGHHVNLQSYEYKKACLDAAEYEYVTK